MESNETKIETYLLEQLASIRHTDGYKDWLKQCGRDMMQNDTPVTELAKDNTPYWLAMMYGRLQKQMQQRAETTLQSHERTEVEQCTTAEEYAQQMERNEERTRPMKKHHGNKVGQPSRTIDNMITDKYDGGVLEMIEEFSRCEDIETLCAAMVSMKNDGQLYDLLSHTGYIDLMQRINERRPKQQRMKPYGRTKYYDYLYKARDKSLMF